MLYNFKQGELDIVIETDAPLSDQTVLHGIMVGVCDGGIDENYEPICTRVAPRKFHATGSYSLIEFKGTFKNNSK